MEVYLVDGSLKGYLAVDSVLLLVAYFPFTFILLGVRAGYYFALLPALFAPGNGIIYLIGFLKTGLYKGAMGGGLLTGIPLRPIGGWVLYQLLIISIQ